MSETAVASVAAPVASVEVKPDMVPLSSSVPAGLVVAATRFPEALVAEPVALPLPHDDFITGNIVWAQSYRAAKRYEAFQVFVCDGDCELPMLRKMKELTAGAPLVMTKTAPLSGGRAVEASLMSMMLGGALAISSSRSPAGRFHVVAFASLPLHDMPVSAAARKFYGEIVPLDLALALGRALDAALFP